jgi:predicted small metal-binding protein
MGDLSLYTVDYWIPFPSSEYGGVYVVAAKDEDEVVDLCLKATDEWHIESYGEDMEQKIRDRITLIGTTTLFERSCVVKSFYT